MSPSTLIFPVSQASNSYTSNRDDGCWWNLEWKPESSEEKSGEKSGEKANEKVGHKSSAKRQGDLSEIVD